MQIYMASDHTAIEQRHEIGKYLKAKGYEVIDLGCESSPSNYAEYGIKLGEEVVNHPGSLGIAMCGTGIGISIACNKVKGVRCGLVDRVENASLIKEHNNANVLSMGARTTSIDDMKKIVDAYLSTNFAGERHQERIDTISNYEKK